jgi:glycosyltransferase involved in cell wall biosynthesis
MSTASGIQSALVLLVGEVREDPRVTRICRSLRDSGVRVTVGCTDPSGRPPEEVWEDIRVVRFPHRRESLLKRMYLAVQGRISPKKSDMLGRMHEGSGSSGVRAAVRELAAAVNVRTFVRETARINREMTARFSGESFDFIHANDVDTLPAGGALKRMGAARALVYDSHEYWPGIGVTGSVSNRAIVRLESDGIRAADRVMTVNHFIADMLRRDYRLPETPSVVMNCPLRDDTPVDTDTPGTPVRVLYQGKLQAFRGIGELIRAFGGIEGAMLTVSGDGPLLERFRRMAEHEGLGGRVRFTGRYEPDETLDIVRGHDIGMLPFSPVTGNIIYSSPNKLFDYMMGGLAVVSTDLPFIRGVVEGDRAGLLLTDNAPESIAAAICSLAAEPMKLALFRRNARTAALTKYSWEAQFGSNYPWPGETGR